MSIQAESVNIAIHGQIGKQWIYFVRKGVQYKRPYVIPFDPKTFNQRTQRNKFRLASQMWNDLSPEEKEEWKVKVEKTQYALTAYNYFLRIKIKEMKDMIKRIIKDTVLLVDGINFIDIPEVDTDKCILHYNCYLSGDFDDISRQYGIYRALIFSSTQIKVFVKDPATLGDVRIRYQIIEYV